jgi:hypothetical protein
MERRCLGSRISKKDESENRIFGAERRVSEIANGIRVSGDRGLSLSATYLRLIQGYERRSRNIVMEENSVGSGDVNYREWDNGLAL